MTETEAGFVSLRASEDNAGSRELSYSDEVNVLRNTFASGKTRSIVWRKQQLGKMRRMFEENHEAITAAIRADHGGAKFRGVV